MRELATLKMENYGENVYYRHRAFQLSKAYWKMVEKEWKHCINQYDLNINEYTILLSVCYYGKITATQLSEVGMMHVSTALNFSKKLEQAGLVSIRKDVFDRRTTIIEITDKGLSKISEIENYWENKYNKGDIGVAVTGLIDSKEYVEQGVMSILQNYYGDNIMEHIDFICDTVKKETISKNK